MATWAVIEGKHLAVSESSINALPLRITAVVVVLRVPFAFSSIQVLPFVKQGFILTKTLKAVRSRWIVPLRAMRYCALLSCIVANLHSVCLFISYCDGFIRRIKSNFTTNLCLFYRCHQLLVLFALSEQQVFQYGSLFLYEKLLQRFSWSSPHNRANREWLGINALLVNFSFVRLSISSFVF